MKRSAGIVFLLCIVCVLLEAPAFAEEYHFLAQWGDTRPPMADQINTGRGIAVDNAGNVYVSDTYGNRIIKYDSQGNILAKWTDCNGSPINYPMQISVAHNNNVYVVDSDNKRVVVYSSGGVCLDKIAEGQSERPLGVAVDSDLNVYVTNNRNHRLKKYDSSGALVANWYVYSPWGVTVSGDYVYVTEKNGDKVNKFTKDGTFIKKWGSFGVGDGQFFLAGGIAEYQGLLYVADIEHHRIQVFDLEGAFVRTIGERGTGIGQLQFPTAVAVDRNNGWLYLSDDDNSRVVRFDLNTNPPTYSSQWGCDSSGSTGLRYPTKLAVDDQSGVLYVVDSGNQRIMKLTLGLGLLSEWGSYGDGDGQFRFPIDIAVDSAGDVYVVDNVRRNVQKFDSSGNFLSSWDVNFDPLTYLYGLHAIHISSNSTMYIVDASTRKAYILDSMGNFVSSWTVDRYTTGLTADAAGSLYLTSFNNPDDRVQKFDSSGNPVNDFLDSLGTSVNYFGPYFTTPSGQQRLFHPWDVAVVEKGNMLIADASNNRIVKFDSSGGYLTQWGTTWGLWDMSSDPGKFALPYGIAADKNGYVYVADTNNHRIQKFARVVFTDVPAYYWALPFVNKIYDSQVTAGCGDGTTFCPEDPVTRAMMAVFILKSVGQPPAASCTGAVFDDINAASVGEGFCKYIEQFASLGITSGCVADDPATVGVNEARYCPNENVTRAQMAVFLTKALNEQPAASCTGMKFNDVNTLMMGGGNLGDAFCRNIEQFATLGITSGCSADNPATVGVNEARYCPDENVTRAQMAVFLTKAFLQ